MNEAPETPEANYHAPSAPQQPHNMNEAPE
jgi:hypothetical protein